MKAPARNFRIYAEVVYLQPSFDQYGFPNDLPIRNHDPQIVILSEEMGELIAEVTASDEQDLHARFRRLADLNRNHAIITLREGNEGMVEL